MTDNYFQYRLEKIAENLFRQGKSEQEVKRILELYAIEIIGKINEIRIGM